MGDPYGGGGPGPGPGPEPGTGSEEGAPEAETQQCPQLVPSYEDDELDSQRTCGLEDPEEDEDPWVSFTVCLWQSLGHQQK